ncbi:MAG: hypothetical protein ACRDYX_16815 [Egibacteraceae bacterium]
MRAAEHVATHLAGEHFADPNRETVRAVAAPARTLTRSAWLCTDSRGSRSVERDRRLRHAQRAGQRGPAWFDDAVALAREAGDRGLKALVLAATYWTASPGLWIRRGGPARLADRG